MWRGSARARGTGWLCTPRAEARCLHPAPPLALQVWMTVGGTRPYVKSLQDLKQDKWAPGKPVFDEYKGPGQCAPRCGQ